MAGPSEAARSSHSERRGAKEGRPIYLRRDIRHALHLCPRKHFSSRRPLHRRNLRFTKTPPSTQRRRDPLYLEEPPLAYRSIHRISRRPDGKAVRTLPRIRIRTRLRESAFLEVMVLTPDGDHNDLHPCSETRVPWRAKPGGSALKQYLDIRKSDIVITKTSGGGEIVSEVNQLCGARDTNVTVLSNNPQRVSPIPSSVDM